LRLIVENLFQILNFSAEIAILNFLFLRSAGDFYKLLAQFNVLVFEGDRFALQTIALHFSLDSTEARAFPIL
jgi:hypothetical protein